MKLFLDDIRNPPDDSWVVVRTAEECMRILQTEKVELCSLDHDLGENVPTGYDVLAWFEECIYSGYPFHIPRFIVHSANPVGRERMEMAIESIERFDKYYFNIFEDEFGE